MRQEERLLIIALNEGAINTVVEIMHSLSGEFLEGWQDWAGDIFNRYFPKLSPAMLKKFIHTSPFRKIANELAEKYGISKPWKVKDPERPWTWEYIGDFPIYMKKYPFANNSEK